MARTGESYTTARMHIVGEQYDADVAAGPPVPAEAVSAIVLKVNERSALRGVRRGDHVPIG